MAAYSLGDSINRCLPSYWTNLDTKYCFDKTKLMKVSCELLKTITVPESDHDNMLKTVSFVSAVITEDPITLSHMLSALDRIVHAGIANEQISDINKWMEWKQQFDISDDMMPRSISDRLNLTSSPKQYIDLNFFLTNPCQCDFV